MVDSVKLLRIDQRIWWSFFIVMLLFAIAVMIGTLATPVWIKLDCDIDSFKFKGSVLNVVDGLDKVPNFLNQTRTVDMEGSNYLAIGIGLCFFKKISDEQDFPSQQWEFLTSWCSFHKNLYMSGSAFVALEICSIACTTVLVVLIVLYFFKHFYWIASYLAAGALWITHTVGTIIWLATVKHTFNNDCTDRNDGNDPPRVCARDGPKLAIFVLVFLPFVMIPYFTVAIILQRKQKPSAEAVIVPPESPDTKKERKTQEFNDATITTINKKDKKSKSKRRHKKSQENISENLENS